jgi:hypothetical protein
MEKPGKRAVSLADPIIAWTTSTALVFFGMIFFDDPEIMGRTILALGVLSATNEALKLRSARSGADYGRFRLALAMTYLVLVVFGFVSRSPAR